LVLKNLRVSAAIAAGLLLASPTAFAAAKGDPAAGKVMYTECEGCHSLKDNKIGPRHCGLIGRKAGSVADFPSYSHAMKDSGLTWDVPTLSSFLADPLSFVQETGMGYIGISDEQSRLDLIAFIEQQGKDPSVCPPQ